MWEWKEEKKGRIHWNLSIYKKSFWDLHRLFIKKSYSMKIIWSGLWWWWHLPFVWILLLPCADLSVEHSEALRLHLSCIMWFSFWYPDTFTMHTRGKARRERERKIESIRNVSLIQAECKKVTKKILTKSIKLYWRYLSLLRAFSIFSSSMSPSKFNLKLESISVHTLYFHIQFVPDLI